MGKQNKGNGNKEIGEDLCRLAQLLIDTGLCKDASALNTAGKECSKLPEDIQWNYSLGKIDFEPDEVGSTIPLNATDLVLRLSLSINGRQQDVKIIHDPLDDLTFDIEIFGAHIDATSDSVVELYCSWHLDRHISKPNDGSTKYSHPLYHFTFGGRKMEDGGLNFGACLILPSPRFAYPPMDAILGIDFILQNYFHKDRIKKLVNMPEYMDIIRKSQERLWQPYFYSLASNWLNLGMMNFSDEFTFDKLFPFLQKN